MTHVRVQERAKWRTRSSAARPSLRDLYQLHRIDPAVAAEDQFGTLKVLQEEGKIRHAVMLPIPGLHPLFRITQPRRRAVRDCLPEPAQVMG